MVYPIGFDLSTALTIQTIWHPGRTLCQLRLSVRYLVNNDLFRYSFKLVNSHHNLPFNWRYNLFKSYMSDIYGKYIIIPFIKTNFYSDFMQKSANQLKMKVKMFPHCFTERGGFSVFKDVYKISMGYFGWFTGFMNFSPVV